MLAYSASYTRCRPSDPLRMGAVERCRQLRQNAIQRHFDASPFRNQWRAKQVALKFMERLLQSSGKNLNSTQLLMHVKVVQTGHFRKVLIGFDVGPGVGHVGVFQRAQDLRVQYTAAGTQLSKEGSSDVRNHPREPCAWVLSHLLMLVVVARRNLDLTNAMRPDD